MSHLLLIETATSVCSAALSKDESLIAMREINEGFSHAAKLTIFISEVLKESGLKLNDVDAIAVSHGPGSYTGLRIGMSVAKGLCFSADKPLITVPTLEAMAFGAADKIKEKDILFCPMIDARRMEVYCALYDDKLNCKMPASALIVDENFLKEFRNKKIIFFGDGGEKCRNLLSESIGFYFSEGLFPSSQYLIEPALKKFKNSEFENIALCEPFYLKEFRSTSDKILPRRIEEH